MSQEDVSSPLATFTAPAAREVNEATSDGYRIWRVIAIAGAGALCLSGHAPPPLALVMGIGIALLLENPWRRHAHISAKWLLQACVVLLGFTMNLRSVLVAGAHGAVFAAISIGVTLGAGILLGKWLGVNRKASLLISAGTAICGGSAIAAVATVIDADQAALSVAMGTVFILNAVALCVFVPIGHALALSQTAFGTWAGIAIHDISSVVAAGARYGPHALMIATAVKLSRALWIIPVTIGVSMTFNRQTGGRDRNNAPGRKGIRAANFPWFIGIFVLASVARTFVPWIRPMHAELQQASTIGISVTLLLIGLGLSRQTLAAVGLRPMVQGIVLWALIASGSLIAILLGA